jgi:ATP-binding cassette subfamily B protein
MVHCGLLLVLYFGGSMVVHKQLSLGEFIAFHAYLAMLVWPMSTVGWISSMMRRGLTSLARIDRLLQTESLLHKSIPKAQPLSCAVQPHFSCRQLNFSYPGSKRLSLQDLSLDVTPCFLAITGKTGSGKSTLCKVLLRYYPVADGQLFFSGLDVNRLDPSLIRQYISYVSNNPILFSGTLADNIRLSKAEASMEEVQDVARLAGIAKDIEAMTQGYQTRLGERGLRLSGGQKQRLALARALLADRPLIILDDALSALDTETGQQVFTALRRALQGKTLILVSHRLQFLAHADEVLLLDQGRLIDRGPHRSLLARNALYRELAEQQEPGEGGHA